MQNAYCSCLDCMHFTRTCIARVLLEIRVIRSNGFVKLKEKPKVFEIMFEKKIRTRRIITLWRMILSSRMRVRNAIHCYGRRCTTFADGAKLCPYI